MFARLLIPLLALALAQPPPGGPPPGGGGGGGSPCEDPACAKKPCPALCLGDVGKTTRGGTDPTGTATSKTTLVAGENIYGPFEAGFGAQQDNIIKGLGCTDPTKGYIEGGIDTNTAEEIVIKGCDIELPRGTGANYISLLRECGGHTMEYHFHERLSCLYNSGDAGHSVQVGVEEFRGAATPALPIYGGHETTGTPPTDLDACGAHFGVTPDSNGVEVYHYHVQLKAPFIIGCHGPDKDSAGNDVLVTVKRCRELYNACSDPSQVVWVDIKDSRHVPGMPTGRHRYHKWCPCYDEHGRNTEVAEDGGDAELAELPDPSNNSPSSAARTRAVAGAALAGAASLALL